jgi:tetratricopeptide (TPR) repeat protein
MEPNAYEPAKSRWHIGRANEELARGDRAAALRNLLEGWRFDPWNDELPLLAAVLQQQQGNAARAAHLAAMAVESRPFHPPAWNVLAVACMDAGRQDLAQRLLERAVRLAPAHENSATNLAEAMARTSKPVAGDADLPIEAIERILAERAPTLSACIVLRDGTEAVLEDTLDCVRDVASERVVIDARKDRTRFAVPDDARFALIPCDASLSEHEAWTEALHVARGDAVLLLAAGETLLDADRGRLVRMLGEPGWLGLAFATRAPSAGATFEVRCVRNAPGLAFGGKAVRRLLPSLAEIASAWGLDVRETPLAVTAVRRAPEMEPADFERLASIDVADHLDDPWCALVKARADCGALRFEQALSQSRRARAMLRGLAGTALRAFEEEAVAVEGACLVRLARFADLGRIVADHHARWPATFVTRYLQAVAAKEAGEADASKHGFLDATSLADRPVWSRLPGASDAAVLDLVGAALLELGELDAADEAFASALSLDPAHSEASLGRLAVLYARGQVEETIRELDRLVTERAEDPTVWVAGGILLGRDPRFATATATWLEEAHERFPQNDDILRRLGEAHLRQGAADRALDVFASLGDGGPTPGARLVASLGAGRELPAVPAAEHDAVGRDVLAWFERWMVYGAIETLDRALCDLSRAEAVVTGLGARVAGWLEAIGQEGAARGVRSRAATGR